MKEFYFFSLLFGILLLFYYLKDRIELKKYKKMVSSKDFIEIKISNIQDVLEKNDKFLFYLRAFDQNIALKILSVFVLFACFYSINLVANLGIEKNTMILIMIFLLIFIILVPQYVQRFITESRIRKIGADIPVFIDLLAICVQSGMSIEAAIRFLEQNASELNTYFRPFLSKLVLRIEVSGLESALSDLQTELPSKEISMMCSTLKQSLKYGSQIYDLLMNLSAEIRENSLLQAEEIIGKLSAKMSIPLILFFMFPVIIIIAAPGVMRVLGGF